MTARRVAATVLVVALVVLAGCSGGGNGTESPETAQSSPDGTTTGTTTPGTETTDTGTAGTPTTTAEPATVVSEAYEFEDGETYSYAANIDDNVFRLGWAVAAVEDPNVTVNVAVGTNADAGSANLTAERGEAFQAAYRMDQLGPLFFVLRLPIRAADGHELSSGNTWTVRSEDIAPEAPDAIEWETATVTVGETVDVAGHECRELTIDPTNNTAAVDACVAEDWPFALTVTDKGGDGTKLVLIDATRP